METSILLYAPARCLPYPQFRERLLDALQAVVAHTHSSVNTVHASGHVSSFSRGFAEERMGEVWAATMAPEEDLLANRAFACLRQAAIVNWTDPDLQAPGMHRVREFLSRFGISHGMGIAVPIEGAYGVTLVHLARREREQPFTLDEADALTAAAPHLIEALMVNRLRANAVRSAQDTSATPVALVTPDRWLIYPNSAFATAWQAMVAIDPSLQVPRIPSEWLDGSVAPDSVLARQGWRIESSPVDDGVRVELFRHRPLGVEDKLTPREREVAQLYGKGYTYKDIGKLLSTSPHTVRAHIAKIFDKLNINSRAVLRTLLTEKDDCDAL